MKKYISVLCLALLLCSCAQTEIPTEETTAETSATVSEILKKEYSPKELYEYYISDGKAVIRRYRDPIYSDSEITVPETIEGYPVALRSSDVFQNTDVTRLTFPESVPVTSITNARCLEVIELPANVSRLTGLSFKGCESLKEINIAEGGEYRSVDGVVYSADGKELICFPHGRTGDFTVPEGVEIIGDDAFGRSLLTSVTLPGSVREIGRGAFMSSDISEIKLNDGLKIINSLAFCDTRLGTLYLPDSVSDIGYGIVQKDKPIKISAPVSLGENKELYDFDVDFRNETMLQKAVRRGKKLFRYFEDNAGENDKLIFADINGDRFPEILVIRESAYMTNSIYEYSDVNGWSSTGVYLQQRLNTYYDRENDCYFKMDIFATDEYIYCECARKLTMDENGEWISEFYGQRGRDIPYDNWDWTKYYFIYSGGGKSEIVNVDTESGKEYTFEDFAAFIEGTLTEYELVESFDRNKILSEHSEKYTVEEGGSHIFIEEGLADEPVPVKTGDDERCFTPPERTVLFKIGSTSYYEDTFYAELNEGECTPENFELLSTLPKLTELYIYCNEADLTGIGKLKGLKELHINGYTSIKEVRELGKLTSLEILRIPCVENIDFLADMDSVRLLILIPWTSNYFDKPADFLAPLLEMDSLEYLPINTYDGIPMTEEQIKWMKENLSHVKYSLYKFA